MGTLFSSPVTKRLRRHKKTTHFHFVLHLCQEMRLLFSVVILCVGIDIVLFQIYKSKKGVTKTLDLLPRREQKVRIKSDRKGNLFIELSLHTNGKLHSQNKNEHMTLQNTTKETYIT